ncbi:MAG: UDP-N-acetylmuramoyl-L-alanine--D-glutamate ligase, partial [Proteobacteria bacterium]|nr:UDP-N-acetylmuramoyl-L-alanine--D-glutamate ligase [Pseudomonadota bacterium]
MDLAGKRVLIVGMGASGRAAARLAVSRGAVVIGADLRTDVEDVRGVSLELGPHRRSTFVGADLIVVSPGVPSDQPDIVAAEARGVPVVGELGFAWQFVNVPAIGVTGTNGKSTVTWFISQLLEAAGLRAFVGGNLGNPLSNAITRSTPGPPGSVGRDSSTGNLCFESASVALRPRIARSTPGPPVDGGDYDVMVLEVSSYQLERPNGFHPHIGVILNLTPDHLKRHGDMDTYGATKCRIFEQMGPEDWAIVCHGDSRLRDLSSQMPGQRLWLDGLPGFIRKDRQIELEWQGSKKGLDLSAFAIPGAHNLSNAATAALCSLLAGADFELVQKSIARLKPLAHRMEVVGEIHGVQWINDSKATNVDATWVAVTGLDRPAVVLLGGEAKGPGFAILEKGLAHHRAVVTFGGSGDTIADELKSVGIVCIQEKTMADAVKMAVSLAKKGDAVLLSPGCASFD